MYLTVLYKKKSEGYWLFTQYGYICTDINWLQHGWPGMADTYTTLTSNSLANWILVVSGLVRISCSEPSSHISEYSLSMANTLYICAKHYTKLTSSKEIWRLGVSGSSLWHTWLHVNPFCGYLKGIKYVPSLAVYHATCAPRDGRWYITYQGIFSL